MPRALTCLLPLMVVLVMGSWITIYLASGEWPRVFARAHGEVKAAIQEEEGERGRTGGSPPPALLVDQLLKRFAAFFEKWSAQFKALHAERIRASVAVFETHFKCGLTIFPLTLLILILGLSLGSTWRDRIRRGSGYASPTAGGVARVAIGTGILWLVLFSLSPLPIPLESVYLSPMVMAGGGALYVANLPLRL